MVNGYLGLSSFPSVDLTQQVLLPLLEELVGKLPSVRYDLSKTIGVELTDEAGEIVVLKVVGEEVASELRGPPNDEGGVVFAPRNDVVGCRIVYQLVRFGEEWSWD